MKIEAAPVAINMMPAQKSLLVPNAIFIDYSVSELGNSRARDYLGITEMPYAALTPFRAAGRNPRSLAFFGENNSSAAKWSREQSRSTTRSARAPLLLLRFDVGFFYDLSPLCRFSHNVGAELDGGHYVHFRALVPEHLLCFRRAQDSQDFLVQPVSDRARRACRRKDAPPVARFVAEI